jgi:monoamine oxidase
MSGGSSEVDVVVVGAGAAGLAAGRRLGACGVSLVIAEARERVGGRAWTVATRLGPVDLGCEWLHSADRNPWTGIARRLGFTVDERLPDWRSRIARRYGDAAQADWAAAYAAFADRMEAAANDAEDRPASTLLSADGRWNAMANAISTWANGVELDRLSVQDHARYTDTGVNWRVLEGYGTLIARYGAALPLRLGCEVRAIDHRGRQIVVTTSRGELRARAAIVTVPTNVLAAGAIRFIPALPDKIAAAQGLPLGLADKLFLALDEAAEDFPADRHVLGHTDRVATGSYQLRPHGRPMIAGYFGGELAAALERAGPQAMADFALAELAGLFGSGIRRKVSLLAASAWAGDAYARGSYSFALPGRAADRRRLAAPVDDRLFFAGEACSFDFFSTAHGALLSGEAAADAALADLGRAAAGSATQEDAHN